MDKYVAADRKLAALLGYSWGKLQEHTLPRWTQDWNTCGPLMFQRHVELQYGTGIVYAKCAQSQSKAQAVYYKDHPSEELAVQYAIVTAVIADLEHAANARAEAALSQHSFPPKP